RRGPLPDLDAPATTGERPAVALFFSGHGSQWLGMGRDLLTEPAYRAALADCDRALAPVLGWSVTEELLAPDRDLRLVPGGQGRYLGRLEVTVGVEEDEPSGVFGLG
ncbi:acyltransferase domain-containing protein, partial [Streptomyces sp. NRRL WC-3725]|uniref:acyltransferase domain-containing protein n=1 Tax=Streptomyces sp. NRRL WC-3725 TaxID=1463933 RepID=UPI0005BB91A6